LSPAVTNSLPGDLHADAGGGQQLRGEFGDQRVDELVQGGDLVVGLQDAPGQGLQGDAGGHHRVAEADGVGKPGSAGAQQLHTGEVAGLVTQFLGRGDDVVAQ